MPLRGRIGADPAAAGGSAGQVRAPRVSVIVPVRDNTEGVRELIDRLAGQSLARSDFEVIVGDDGSQDESCLALATEDGWVRVVRGTPRTSYTARNNAAALARAPVLAFCDSDCLPDPDWLENGLAALRRADVVAGEVSFEVPDSPTVWSLLTVDMFLDQKRNVVFSRGVTANLFVLRSCFDELGGFDPTLPSGGDYDFVRRAVASGARLAYAGDAIVGHPTLDDRRTFLAKVRTTNRWRAARMARAGQKPSLFALFTLLPIVGVALARHDVQRPIWRLEPARLAASGLRPGLGATLQALLLLYIVVAHVAGLAQLQGWLIGRRMPAPAPRDGTDVRLDQPVSVIEIA